MTGAWAILCCGCNRLMSKTGEPLGPRQPGSVNLTELFRGFADSEDVASYQTKEAGDAAAVEAGWSAIGGNHRCPECTAVLSATIDDALSTHRKELADRWGDKGGFFGKLIVAALAPAEILDFGPFDFINIDIPADDADGSQAASPEAE